MDDEQIALWQPGMISWNVCNYIFHDPKDLAFYQGKLYAVCRSKPRLFALELKEDDCGIIVYHVEHCVTEPCFRHPMQLGIIGGSMSCNIVVWRGLLLLIIRYYGDFYPRSNVRRVKVFALDFSRTPYGVAEIDNISGDCIFVGSGRCKSFPDSLHDTVEGDLIYFVPDDWNPYDRFVYNMRNGSIKPFAAKLLTCNFDVPEEIVDFPVWLFLSSDAAEQI
ncbi:unnamed protein product [Urochloa decumbens]|uniref:KIB1-4 beta-propeller domain-containing protein n=1 Tax=Urochloa decumbens TaxID=240449 RepID=A0ABC9B684_9POAL